MNELETSPLVMSIDEITSNDKAKPQWQWSVEFKLQEGAPVDLENPDIACMPREKEGIYWPIMTPNLDMIRDYEKGFCEHANMIVEVGAGMWLKVLSPARHHLRVYITRRVVSREGGTEELEEPLSLVFKPIFKDGPEAHQSIDETIQLTRQELDARGIVQLDVDLLSPAAEAVQSAPCGGTWRDVAAADLMQLVFANVCSQFTFEGTPLITQQVIADKANKTKRKFITIPAGTALTDLPAMLHRHHGGIWPTGVNRFLQDDTWYFYPPYDTERVDNERVTLTIVRAPERTYGGSTRTYLVDGDHVKILASGAIGTLDPTQKQFLQQGDGRRFASAKKVLDGTWLETKDNKAVASRSKNFSEMRIAADEYTDHRILNAPERFTDNALFQLSLLAGKKGQLVNLEWVNADHTLIRPGMPCRILYEENRTVMELKGVVQYLNVSIQTTQVAAAAGEYKCTCSLVIFCLTPEPA